MSSTRGGAVVYNHGVVLEECKCSYHHNVSVLACLVQMESFFEDVDLSRESLESSKGLIVGLHDPLNYVNCSW